MFTSNIGSWLTDIMGDKSNPIQWGEKLFKPGNTKEKAYVTTLKVIAEVNRVKTQLSNLDTPSDDCSMSKDRAYMMRTQSMQLTY